MTLQPANKLFNIFSCIKILKGLPPPVAEIDIWQQTTVQAQSTQHKIALPSERKETDKNATASSFFHLLAI